MVNIGKKPGARVVKNRCRPCKNENAADKNEVQADFPNLSIILKDDPDFWDDRISE